MILNGCPDIPVKSFALKPVLCVIVLRFCLQDLYDSHQSIVKFKWVNRKNQLRTSADPVVLWWPKCHVQPGHKSWSISSMASLDNHKSLVCVELVSLASVCLYNHWPSTIAAESSLVHQLYTHTVITAGACYTDLCFARSVLFNIIANVLFYFIFYFWKGNKTKVSGPFDWENCSYHNYTVLRVRMDILNEIIFSNGRDAEWRVWPAGFLKRKESDDIDAKKETLNFWYNRTNVEKRKNLNERKEVAACCCCCWWPCAGPMRTKTQSTRRQTVENNCHPDDRIDD